MSESTEANAKAARPMNAVMVFVKAPVLGTVKTRLAADIGEDAALLIYRALTEHVIKSVQAENAVKSAQNSVVNKDSNTPPTAPRFDMVPFADAAETQPIVAAWLECETRTQRGADLGERLSGAFEDCFEGYDKVVVIGSDAPYVSPLLGAAFDALARHDCVIGPAFDGGYYLIGLSRTTRRWRELFTDVSWSTSSVFVQTVRNAREAGVDMHVLPALDDIDTVADMRSVNKAYPNGELAALFNEVLAKCENTVSAEPLT